jgi:hypothetical protein
MDLDEKLAAFRSTSCSGNWQRIHARTPANTAAAIMAALAMVVDPIYRYVIKRDDKRKNNRHPGFARGHPPYYWPGLNTLDFPDRTGWGMIGLV